MAPQPLSNCDIVRLNEILDRFGDANAMDLEVLGGFLTALVCGPENVPPSEYLVVIWGSETISEEAFSAQPVLREFMSLIARYRDAIAHALQVGAGFTPLLFADEHGAFHGDEWAARFVRGMQLRPEEWVRFVGDYELGSVLRPILALAAEPNRGSHVSGVAPAGAEPAGAKPPGGVVSVITSAALTIFRCANSRGRIR